MARRAGELSPTSTGRLSLAEWTLAVKYLTGNAAALGGRTPDSILLLRDVIAAAEHTDDPALLICASNGALHVGDDRGGTRCAHDRRAGTGSQLYSEGWGGRRPSTEANTRRAPLLARRTVEYHLRNIFTKIGVRSRTELVARRVARR